MADYILSKTGEEVEAILNSVGDKANASEVYTKIETDTLVGDKANASEVYTKIEIYMTIIYN